MLTDDIMVIKTVKDKEKGGISRRDFPFKDYNQGMSYSTSGCVRERKEKRVRG